MAKVFLVDGLFEGISRDLPYEYPRIEVDELSEPPRLGVKPRRVRATYRRAEVPGTYRQVFTAADDGEEGRLA